MLIPRLLAALVLIPCVVILLFWLPVNAYSLVIISLITLAAWEWAQFLRITQPIGRCLFALLWAAALLLFYYGVNPYYQAKIYSALLLSAFGWWFTALLLVITFPNSQKIWQNSVVLKFLLALLTLLPFFAGMITLRAYHFFLDHYLGAYYILYILVVIWATDSGAYFAGRLFGKHKLAPKVSPGKTWQGFAGGILAALIVTGLAYHFHLFALSAAQLFGYTLLATLASSLGDLTESMFKREAGIKDSSHLIPGHGGVLDRIDSLTAAVPLFTAMLFL